MTGKDVREAGRGELGSLVSIEDLRGSVVLKHLLAVQRWTPSGSSSLTSTTSCRDFTMAYWWLEIGGEQDIIWLIVRITNKELETNTPFLVGFGARDSMKI